MGFFIFLIVLKVVLTVAFFMGTAWLMAEYLPLLATKLAHMADGTWADSFGEWGAKALKTTARYAAKFYNVCVEWLQFIGVELKKYNTELLDKAEDAAEASSI